MGIGGVMAKYIIDKAGATVGLLVLGPFFCAIALLIKLESSGPVFFRHERLGKNGVLYSPFKFRTMVQGAMEKGLKDTVAVNDERITRVGAFLRKWGIDELPQLLNVLKGEMSIVGPRPAFQYHFDRYSENERQRLSVKPGIVGLALIKGRNRITWKKRIEYDIWYVNHWSLWLDLKIMVQSIYTILVKQEGEYGEGGVNDTFEQT